MKIAILFSGTAYNFRQSVQSLMDNIIIPNDADVFILTSKENQSRKTPTGKVIDNENANDWSKKTLSLIRDEITNINTEDINFLNGVFGERLKVLDFIEDHPEYMEYLKGEIKRCAEKINEISLENIENEIVPLFLEPIKTEDNSYLQSIVHQYNHVKKCYEMMCDHEQKNGFKYDYVVRMRIDFIADELIKFDWYYLNQDYPYINVFGSVRRNEFEWIDEFCFFARRDAAEKLFANLNLIGFITDKKYKTIDPARDHDMMFSAETQFSLLLYELNLIPQQINIWRSADFTYDVDGFDLFNYKFSIGSKLMRDEYAKVCLGPSDINEHLPILKEYAEKCNHVTELGTRCGNSAVAFMAAKPKTFITYDVANNARIDYLKMIAEDNLINFTFILGDVLKLEIEETDLLFIDTNHHKEQCEIELQLHPDKARKYIIFHDVSTFWEKGQGGGGGLRYAIEPFMQNHPEWKQVYRTAKNNGLLILERK